MLADPRVLFQTHLGFGGAFTEAAAHTYYKLSEKNRQAFLRAYFDLREGNGYTLCRTHINSCDFALGNYASVEQDGDMELKTFNLNGRKKSSSRSSNQPRQSRVRKSCFLRRPGRLPRG